MTHSTTPIAVFGVSGRMGRALLQALEDSNDLSLVGATASASSAWLGKDVSALGGARSAGVLVSADAMAAVGNAKVVVDFTLAACHCRQCCRLYCGWRRNGNWRHWPHCRTACCD